MKRRILVYFIRAHDGSIKIGSTGKIVLRLHDLQLAHAHPLRLVGLLPGGQGEEYALHARFRDHRMMGEWFAPAPEIEKLIAVLDKSLLDHLDQAYRSCSCGATPVQIEENADGFVGFCSGCAPKRSVLGKRLVVIRQAQSRASAKKESPLVLHPQPYRRALMAFNPAALCRRLKELGKTQLGVAETLNVAPSKVNNWFTKGRDVEERYREPLAAFLKSTVEDLNLDSARSALKGGDPESESFEAPPPAEELSAEQRFMIAQAKASAAQVRATQVRTEKAKRPKKTDPDRAGKRARAMAQREASSYLARVWYEELVKIGASAPDNMVWSREEGMIVWGLLKQYSMDDLERGFRFTIGSWLEIRKKFFRADDPFPSLTVFSRNHVTLLVLAKDGTSSDLDALEAEWNEWHRTHQFEDPPEDLQRRFDEARPRLQARWLKK